MKALITAAALAALVTGPAFANALPQPTDQQVPVRVSTAGLNLNDQQDLAKLRNRVNMAVAEACNPADRFIVTALPADRQCREQALRDANQLVDRLAAAATSNRVAAH